MARINFSLACAYCGTSLEGHEPQDSCSGCGRRIGQTLNLDVIDIDHLSINKELPCTSCGYNLYLQPLHKVCPECAQPVIESLPHHPLRNADVAWLGKIVVGSVLLLISNFVLYMPWPVMRMCIPWAVLRVTRQLYGDEILHWLGLFLPVMWFAGVIMVTAMDRPQQYQLKTYRKRTFVLVLRGAARIAAMLYLFIRIMGSLYWTLGIPGWSILFHLLGSDVLFIVDHILLVLSYIAMALYIRQLLNRDGSGLLSRLIIWWIASVIIFVSVLSARHFGVTPPGVIRILLEGLRETFGFVFWGLGLVILAGLALKVRRAIALHAVIADS